MPNDYTFTEQIDRLAREIQYNHGLIFDMAETIGKLTETVQMLAEQINGKPEN